MTQVGKLVKHKVCSTGDMTEPGSAPRTWTTVKMVTLREAAWREPLYYPCECPVHLKSSQNNKLFFKKGTPYVKAGSCKSHFNTCITGQLPSPRPVTMSFHKSLVWHNTKIFPGPRVDRRGATSVPHGWPSVLQAWSSEDGQSPSGRQPPRLLAQQSPPEFSRDTTCASAGRGGTQRHHSLSPPWSTERPA